MASTRSDIRAISRHGTRRRRSRATADPAPEVVLQAIANWFRDVDPFHWATAGDPAPYIHNGGYGALFGAVVLLAVAGVVLVLSRRRADLWWRYVLVATLLVPIPAALTVDRHNAIRLAALPVLLVVLAIPAIDALVGGWRHSRFAQLAAAVLAVSIGVQFVQFIDVYRTRGPARLVLFDAGVEPLLEGPLAAGETIYVDFDDRGAQAQARWRVAEAGLPDDRVVILPDGGVPPSWVAALPPVPGLRLRVRGGRSLGGVPARAGDGPVTRPTRASRASRDTERAG